MEDAVLEELKLEARKFLSYYGCHGFEHTERVLRTCQYFGEENNADLSILMPAAVLMTSAEGMNPTLR